MLNQGNNGLIIVPFGSGIIDKAGAWYAYEGDKIGQGRENAKKFLAENPEIYEKINTSIRANAGLIAEQILEGEPEKDEEEDKEPDV